LPPPLARSVAVLMSDARSTRPAGYKIRRCGIDASSAIPLHDLT
jgi:hypothetical protein